jgi:hypothetical protein
MPAEKNKTARPPHPSLPYLLESRPHWMHAPCPGIRNRRQTAPRLRDLTTEHGK